MNNFEKYGFEKTDSSVGEMDHDEYYFEIETDDKLKAFMQDFGISLEDFDTDDANFNDSFTGLDFQVSKYSDGSAVLEFGPIFSDNEGACTTVDVVECNIEGLLEYLLSTIEG